MNILSIADEVHFDLGGPTDLSPSAIALWLRYNIGYLNSRLFSSFSIATNGELSPDLSLSEKEILKKFYLVKYYGDKARSFLGAAAIDPVVEVSEAGGTIRLLNKNELSKTFTTLKRQESEELDKLIIGYNIGGASPLQVTGDDTVEGSPSVLERDRF